MLLPLAPPQPALKSRPHADLSLGCCPSSDLGLGTPLTRSLSTTTSTASTTGKRSASCAHVTPPVGASRCAAGMGRRGAARKERGGGANDGASLRARSALQRLARHLADHGTHTYLFIHFYCCLYLCLYFCLYSYLCSSIPILILVLRLILFILMPVLLLDEQ